MPKPDPASSTRRRPTRRRSTTSCGTFVIKLDPKQAPKTGGSFVTLARKGFYDGLGFHRIAPGFVIQGGDPAGNGSGGPGYKVRESARPTTSSTRRAWSRWRRAATSRPARRAASSSSSPAQDANLPPDYALLGQVTKGLDVVHRIEDLGSTSDGPPSAAGRDQEDHDRGEQLTSGDRSVQGGGQLAAVLARERVVGAELGEHADHHLADQVAGLVLRVPSAASSRSRPRS